VRPIPAQRGQEQFAPPEHVLAPDIVDQAFPAPDTLGAVTPLRDGMNLVAKEYVAAQDPEDPGVLILSRFAVLAPDIVDQAFPAPDTLGARHGQRLDDRVGHFLGANCSWPRCAGMG
jgi:hypothetical protein